MGISNFAVIKDPSDLTKREAVKVQEEFGMFIGTINDLYGENYILVEAVTNDLNSTFSYMVRVDFYNPALAT